MYKKLDIIKVKKECKCGKKFFVERKIIDGAPYITKKEKQCCSRICANSHIQTKEQNKKRSKKLKGNIPWSKGKTWGKNKPVEIVKIKKQKIYCKECNKELKKSRYGYCQKHRGLSKQFRIDCSNRAKQYGCGGYRKGSGIGKSGWYKGYWCDSSWELAWIIYNIEHNIRFIRNKKGFKYYFNEQELTYYPDFILENNIYVEVKGYSTKQWEEKRKQFNGRLQIIGKKEIMPYINYVELKYGKNFIKLYDGMV